MLSCISVSSGLCPSAIGLVPGAFVFGLLAGLFGRPSLLHSAYHCMVLSLVCLVPTALLGWMDWQHFYRGVLVFPFIMKLILAGRRGILPQAAFNPV